MKKNSRKYKICKICGRKLLIKNFSFNKTANHYSLICKCCNCKKIKNKNETVKKFYTEIYKFVQEFITKNKIKSNMELAKALYKQPVDILEKILLILNGSQFKAIKEMIVRGYMELKCNGKMHGVDGFKGKSEENGRLYEIKTNGCFLNASRTDSGNIAWSDMSNKILKELKNHPRNILKAVFSAGNEELQLIIEIPKSKEMYKIISNKFFKHYGRGYDTNGRNKKHGLSLTYKDYENIKGIICRYKKEGFEKYMSKNFYKFVKSLIYKPI